jgi:hypothetical protein
MGKLQRRPIEIFNRADSFSECTPQPSCVTIESNIATAALAQGEAASDKDGLMPMRLRLTSSLMFRRQFRWWR